MKKYSILFYLMFGTLLSTSAQSSYDQQLKNIIAVSNADKRVDTLEKFIKFLVFEDPEMAIVSAKKLIPLATNMKYSKSYLTAYNVLGLASLYTEQNNNAIKYLDTLIKLAAVRKDTILKGKGHGNLGLVYDRMGDFKKAFEQYSMALKCAELLKNKSLTASSYGNLGNVSVRLNQYQEAIKYLNQAVVLFQATGNKKSEANQYNSLAQAYDGLHDEVSRKSYLVKAETIYREIGEKKALGTVLTNLGTIESEAKNSKMAISLYEEALKLKVETGDYNGEATVCVNLSSEYATVGQLEKAYQKIVRAEEIAKNEDDLFLKSEVMRKRAMLLSMRGKHSEAYDLLLDYISLKDSVLGRETQMAVAEYKEKYESEKKEFEIERLTKAEEIGKLKIRQNEEQLGKEKAQRYLIIGVLFFIILLFLVMIWAFIQKRKSGQVLKLKNDQLEHANAEILFQKEEITEKQKEILDSIHYARRIQQALLAHKDFVDRHIAHNFIFFKPKDIVSGDFYWAAEHKNKFYLAVCDSTGHGVPGAFMSLLNIGFLSEAIKEKEILEPHLVFNYVRQRLIESISKEEQKDGMDGILICIDKLTGQVSYAAAHNAPVLIRHKSIMELPKDKMPIGKGENTESFNLYKIDKEPGDVLYLYTDGYADQFGGPKGKKFKYKPLNELLQSVCEMPFAGQEKAMEQALQQWQGNLEQVDDICVIGIKL